MNEISRAGVLPTISSLMIMAALGNVLPAPHVDRVFVKLRTANTYSYERIQPTFSEIDPRPVIAHKAALGQFSNELAAIYADLLANQQPLGAEFEAAWANNIGSLYES